MHRTVLTIFHELSDDVKWFCLSTDAIELHKVLVLQHSVNTQLISLNN